MEVSSELRKRKSGRDEDQNEDVVIEQIIEKVEEIKVKEHIVHNDVEVEKVKVVKVLKEVEEEEIITESPKEKERIHHDEDDDKKKGEKHEHDHEKT